jgi:hypothetical protein
MSGNNLAYLPSLKGFYNPPLCRYLPPLPKGVISEWLLSNTNPGDLILDPLGSNPMLALEAANQSRRVLFARNNPIIWLILEALASAPSENQIQSLVSKLLLSRQVDETLDLHLQSIYMTACMECGNTIQPQGFIWEQDALIPTSKVYNCSFCGDTGERTVSEQDIKNLERLGNIRLQRTRAFYRVMQGGDYEKDSIEAALNCFLPRAIYVAMLLINRLDGLILKMSERRLLQAILLSVFDDATSLWRWPEKDQRHLQLSVPTRFIEKNLWLSLDNAAKTWFPGSSPVCVTYWPKLPPPEGGICFYQRQLTDQKGLLQNEKPTAIVSVFPRPNQAFWTLSALWSGWLWGRKGVTPMRSALSRRRYEWHWFAQAISSSIKPLTSSLINDTRAFGLFPQVTGNFYLGLQAGMRIAGFDSVGAAYRAEDDLIQCQWKLASIKINVREKPLRSLIFDFLETRGEPATILEITLQCLTELALAGNLPAQINLLGETLFSKIQEEVSLALRDDQFAQCYKSNLSTGSQWWLSETGSFTMPVSEKVEKTIHGLLLEGKPIDNRDLERLICKQFPGSQTPSAELIRLCLESYADPSLKDSHSYILQAEDSTLNRQNNVNEMRAILSICSEKLGFIQEIDAEFIKWKSSKGQFTHRYFIIITGLISETMLSLSNDDEIRNIIVCPGSRSRLIDYRIKHDPRLEIVAEKNWHFVKFRTLRRLAQYENLTLDAWNEILDSDPPLWDPPSQFQLF